MTLHEKGTVQIYTGDGKGKTTAALGLILRTVGHNGKAALVQFMKGWDYYGETIALERLPEVTHIRTGRADFVNRDDPDPIDMEEAARGLKAAVEVTLSGDFDLVVLDEINVAMDYALISTRDVLALIDRKPEHVEIVLTGRNAPSQLMERADLITEMVEHRHHYRKGVSARKGVEY